MYWTYSEKVKVPIGYELIEDTDCSIFYQGTTLLATFAAWLAPEVIQAAINAIVAARK